MLVIGAFFLSYFFLWLVSLEVTDFIDIFKEPPLAVWFSLAFVHFLFSFLTSIVSFFPLVLYLICSSFQILRMKSRHIDYWLRPFLFSFLFFNLKESFINWLDFKNNHGKYLVHSSNKSTDLVFTVVNISNFNKMGGLSPHSSLRKR